MLFERASLIREFEKDLCDGEIGFCGHLTSGLIDRVFVTEEPFLGDAWVIYSWKS